MADHQDLLFEIGTEDLPAKSINTLAHALKNNIAQGLAKTQLTYKVIHSYSTHRRLAIKIDQLMTKQPTQYIERKGPALTAAFDKQGNPTPACAGFAKSCGVEVSQLEKQETAQGTWLYFRQTQPGKSATELLPEVINTAIKKLPIPKPMRWGNNNIEFIRPVQWVILLLGSELINAEILGKKTQRETYGHRFHYPAAITITHPAEYLIKLAQPGYVIADPEQRKVTILAQTKDLLPAGAQAQYDEDLLAEVINLVEWPVALIGSFAQEFLNIPAEALITSMKAHQKCFAVEIAGKLIPHFITISNIDSKDKNRVIEGNERVIRARLTDAKFFYQTDLKQPLVTQRTKLNTVLFQQKLGSLFDKSDRIAKLASFIASEIKVNELEAKQAAELCKADLMTEMVGEFPELQGVMGYYYALAHKEKIEIAQAIKEHYYPRFAGDQIPNSLLGCTVALADRIDTLVGIFGINQAPTGDKDPFGLRRAALGILRILIEKQLPLDLNALLQHAFNNYVVKLPNQDTILQTATFIMERLRAWYLEQGIKTELFNAVYASCPTKPWDFQQRLYAVIEFTRMPEAEALAAANKRVSNILKKQGFTNTTEVVDTTLFEHESENTLYKLIEQKKSDTSNYLAGSQYKELLQNLAQLQKAVDNFFDNVMVMSENLALRNNRLILLNNLRKLFLHVADISQL